MNDRGSHKLSLTGTGGVDESRRFCWWCLLLPVILVAWYLADAIFGSKLVLPVPQPPQARVAVLKAIDISGIANPITIVLTGVNYDFIYETVESLSQASKMASKKDTFFADLKNNKISGKLESATTVVIVGSVGLSIATIDEHDILHADAFVHRNKVNAYFNFSQSAAGPAGTLGSDTRKRRIIIVGDLTNINFPTTRGGSEARISILELAPTDEELKTYSEAVRRYESRTEERRADRKTDQQRRESRPSHK